MAKLLDGSKLSAAIRKEIRGEVDCFSVARPCLAVVLCTDDPASEIYVRKKREACEEVGITSYLLRPFEGGVGRWSDPMGHLLSTIDYLNNDRSVHGVLVQLPLPQNVGIDQYAVFDKINPLKDVDVFSPENVGLLVQGRPRFRPCTPQAVTTLLNRNGISTARKKVCIINRSDVVGKPLHAMLIQNTDEANATVCLCHDWTPPDRLKSVCLSSDIIVVAVGKPNFLTADMVPDGCVVIDVGINRLQGSGKVVGDVDFEAVEKKCSWITPVPGGVGPMTVTMLMDNAVRAAKLQLGIVD